MFGNLVNKNARAALKEYGDHNGALVDFDISPVELESSNIPQFTAMARVGDRHFPSATASSKKDAKEYAADLALQALAQGTIPNMQIRFVTLVSLYQLVCNCIFCFSEVLSCQCHVLAVLYIKPIFPKRAIL